MRAVIFESPDCNRGFFFTPTISLYPCRRNEVPAGYDCASASNPNFPQTNLRDLVFGLFKIRFYTDLLQGCETDSHPMPKVCRWYAHRMPPAELYSQRPISGDKNHRATLTVRTLLSRVRRRLWAMSCYLPTKDGNGTKPPRALHAIPPSAGQGKRREKFPRKNR